MNSKDKDFLEKFCVKESSNLIGLENFGVTGWVGWDGIPASKTMTKSPPIRVPPPPDFYIFPIKALLPHGTPPYC